MSILLWNKNFTANNLRPVDALALVNHAEIFIARQLIKKKRRLVRQDYVREIVAAEKIFVVNSADREVNENPRNGFLTLKKKA